MRSIAAVQEQRRTPIACAGKAGGFLALDWQDGGATGALGRLSFKLHQELADTLGKDIGYRRVQTLSAAASPIGNKTGQGLLHKVNAATHRVQFAVHSAHATSGCVQLSLQADALQLRTFCTRPLLD